MLNVLVSGTLVADPKRRQTSAGKDFATALVRVPAEDSEPMLASVVAFGTDAVAAILALAKGDSLAVAGRAKLTSWTKDGEEKHGLSVVADQVLTLYAIEKRRKRTQGDPEPVPDPAPRQPFAAHAGGGTWSDMQDDIPA